MKHLSELLKHLEDAESTYKSADSFLDGGSLEFILAKEQLKQARFAFDKACAAYVKGILKGTSENVYELSDV